MTIKLLSTMTVQNTIQLTLQNQFIGLMAVSLRRANHRWIKRMFDYLLNGKQLSDFLRDYAGVPRDMATAVLESDATIFYEDISKALDKIGNFQGKRPIYA